MNWQGVKGAISRGWIKGALSDHRGNVCLMGAVLNAESKPWAWVTPYEIAKPYANAMAPVIREQFADRVLLPMFMTNVQVCVEFNNHPDTTKEDVLMVIEKVMANA